MKRMRVDASLTGGTGDVNPQWMSFNAVQSSADTTTTTSQAIPVQRLPTGGRAQVLELLRARVGITSYTAIASATETIDKRQLFLSTTSFGTTTTNLGDPRVFMGWQDSFHGAFTAAGTYGSVHNDVFEVDLSDGSGHGILIATDNIFAQVASTGIGAVVTANIKLLYRWKNVGLQEYIGLVQSQQ